MDKSPGMMLGGGGGGTNYAPMYAAGGGGAGVSSLGRPALAAVRESQAYLNSVAGLPVSSHRTAPRLAMPRSAAQAQADLQMMDSARRVFALYDRDGSGDIDSRELLPALRDLGLVNTDTAQASAILARYDSDRSTKLDFVEFTQLLHELREFQMAANRAAAGAEAGRVRPPPPGLPPPSIGVAPGGMGGFYSPGQIAEMQAASARQEALAERERYQSLDAGPPP